MDATAAYDNIEHAENGLSYSLDNWMYNSNHPANFPGG